MTTFDQQSAKVRNGKGFLAALDQSGGSTPKALRLYGISEDSYSTDAEMFDLIHQMRSRIITSPAFNGDRIVGAILFEATLDRQIEGKSSASYLWENKNVVPFLKVDKGLAELDRGVQMMKPMPSLAAVLDKARAQPVFGTKMRSVIKMADAAGIAAIVAQQFEVAQQILAAGLVPIIEPEVDIHSPEKAAAEAVLRAEIIKHLDALDDNRRVMLKLTPPSSANFYRECIQHPRTLRVVALSGGYSRDEANAKVAENNGMIASFSRALTEGLSVQQSDAEFNALLDSAIQSIYEASLT